jgi:hypothetical protein
LFVFYLFLAEVARMASIGDKIPRCPWIPSPGFCPITM